MGEILPMLALSPTMVEGTVVKWDKQEGQGLQSGEVLCEVETDKAVMDYEVTVDGTLLKILVPEGQAAVVGEPIAIVGEAGGDVGPLMAQVEGMRQAARAQKPPPAEQPPGAKKVAEARKATPPEVTPSRVEEKGEEKREGTIASPLARKLAGEMGLDIRSIRGSGPGGRIIQRDIEQAAERQEAAPVGARKERPTRKFLREETIPISGKRRTIAQRLVESKFSAPHYYLTAAVQMDSILRARQELNTRRQGQGEPKVSLNAFLIKLAAMALARHPEINATWNGETITRHGRADIALAVAVEDGLVAPVVRDCVNLGIIEIDEQLQALVAKARANRLAPEDFSDATFTISNLGSYGVESFTAIINPPGSATLAVGSIAREMVVNERDEPEVHSILRMTLSCDHRVIDGATGAAFLQDLKEMMASPVTALY